MSSVILLQTREGSDLPLVLMSVNMNRTRSLNLSGLRISEPIVSCSQRNTFPPDLKGLQISAPRSSREELFERKTFHSGKKKKKKPNIYRFKQIKLAYFPDLRICGALNGALTGHFITSTCSSARLHKRPVSDVKPASVKNEKEKERRQPILF